MLDKIKELVKTHPFHYSKMIKSNKILLAFIKQFPGKELKEQVYVALNGEVSHLCKHCGKLTNFITVEKGYRDFCDMKCQTEYLKVEREKQGIEKLNSFGNLKYISGYQGSHSKVKVKNTKCGCTFDVIFNNAFTNPDYCPIHGVQNRTEKLLSTMSNGLSEESKKKRKQTFEDTYTLKCNKIKLENELIANEVLSEGREFMIQFLAEMFNQYKSNTEIMLSRFPSIHKMIKNHYGTRFGQKLYNFVHKIDSIDNHPKCLECGKNVNYKLTSNKYHEFCSIECKMKSTILVDRMYKTQIEKYGGWHLSTDESK